MKNENLKKYADDIATIKSILLDVEGRPIIEYWAFLSWGVIFLIGGIINIIAYNYLSIPVETILTKVWPVLLLIAIVLETVAWIKNSAKEKIPLFTKSIVKFVISGMGLFIAMIFISIIFIQSAGIANFPVVVMIFFGTFMLLYGILTINIFPFAYLMIFSGMIIYFLNLNLNNQIIAGSFVIGIFTIAAGITQLRDERKRNE
jgi:MFS family permease